MYVLAIETTGPVGSVAVADMDKPNIQDENDIPMKVTTRSMSHLKNLMAMTSDLLSEEGIEPGEIGLVAASKGPGSFTGIRIGVSTARALAQGLGIPVIGVPTLEEFKEKVSDGQTGSDARAGSDGSVLAILNARRGQVYGALYGPGDDGCATYIAPGPYMLSDMLEIASSKGLLPKVYGDGYDAYSEDTEFSERLGKLEAAPKEERYQDAGMTARLALEMAESEENLVGYNELMPDYMRESEAEQRLKDGSLEKMRKAKLERLLNGGLRK